jgi:hypothetical protein
MFPIYQYYMSKYLQISLKEENMKIDQNFKNLLLAILITYGGVLWLNVWHQLGHNHGLVSASEVLSWLRDSTIILLPVMLAVWSAFAIVQWLINLSNGRMSPLAQSILSVAFTSILTSAVFILIESNRGSQTGLANDFALSVSICSTIYSTGIKKLGTLMLGFSNFDVTRIYIMLQDLAGLMLVSMSVTFLLPLIIGEFEMRFAPLENETPLFRAQENEI